MKVFTVIFLSLNYFLLAQNPFSVPKGEIGKTGTYSIHQVGIPVNKDYEEIIKSFKNLKLEKDPTEKFYELKYEKASFKIHVPNSYSPLKPAGVIVLAISSSQSTEEELAKAFEHCEYFAHKRNFICVGINTENPDFENLKSYYSFHTYEYALLLRRAVDIVKERYKTEFGRVIAFTNNEPISLFWAAITSPQVFKNTSYIGTVPVSLVNSVKTTSRTLMNKYLVYYPLNVVYKKSLAAERTLNSSNAQLFSTYKFTNFQYEEFALNGVVKDPLILSEIKIYDDQFELMIEALDKLDPKFPNRKKLLSIAQKAELKGDHAIAYSNYKIAAQAGFSEAYDKFNELKTELEALTTQMIAAHKERDFPASYKIMSSIFQKFGSKSSLDATKIYQIYSKDKKIILEIKASKRFETELEKFRKNKSNKEVLKTLCENILESIPNSKTAMRAREILSELR